MNIKMIIGALKSPKTPQHLKKALLKKYAKQLAGQVKDMGALSSTIRASIGEVYTGNPKKKISVGDIIRVTYKDANFDYMVTKITSTHISGNVLRTGDKFSISKKRLNDFKWKIIDRG